MRLAIITGTRPDIIRLSEIIKKSKKYFDTTHIYTNQNFDYNLSKQFFKEFGITPDIIYNNNKKYNGNIFIGKIFIWLDKYLKKNKFDATLILGDTNSSFAAASVSKRLKIPIFHMEAGNRCYDPYRVPEEINRYQIDSISDWHLCYTQRSREQLLLEGKHPSRVIVVGNPIVEVIHKNLGRSNYTPKEKFYLSTIHRKENINNQNRLKEIIDKLNSLDKKVKLSAHPSLISKLKKFKIGLKFKNIELFSPSDFSDFIKMESLSDCVITDSGTVPEECYILNKPSVLLRYSTERPELLESNAMVVCSDPNNLKKAIQISINESEEHKINMKEYNDYVSNNVIKLLMRYK